MPSHVVGCPCLRVEIIIVVGCCVKLPSGVEITVDMVLWLVVVLCHVLSCASSRGSALVLQEVSSSVLCPAREIVISNG